MSMSGDSLTDWQTIVKALNERVQAMGRFKLSSLTQIPVPTTKDHITQAFVNAVGNSVVQCFTKRYNTTGWCVPANPLIITHPGDPGWAGMYQTGNYLYGPNFWINEFNTWGGIDSKSIYEEVPSFGSIPLRGAEREKIGDFLDWCGDALKLLTKSSCGTCVTDNTGAIGSFRWTISTGEIYDTSDYSSPIGTASTYSDFYTFALAHLTPMTSTGNPYCRKRVYNNGTVVYLTIEYCSCPVRYGYGTGNPILTTPGMINADLIVYYSSFGDNCGYTVNSSSTHIDYSTIAFQNVGPESTVNFGFDISSISTAPTMPTAGNEIEIKEYLENIYAVWDFSNHFQYCV